MKKLETVILSIGAVALIAGLIMTFIVESPGKWGIGCFALAGIALVGEWLFYILSAADLCAEKARESTENQEEP